MAPLANMARWVLKDLWDLGVKLDWRDVQVFLASLVSLVLVVFPECRARGAQKGNVVYLDQKAPKARRAQEDLTERTELPVNLA